MTLERMSPTAASGIETSRSDLSLSQISSSFLSQFRRIVHEFALTLVPSRPWAFMA